MAQTAWSWLRQPLPSVLPASIHLAALQVLSNHCSVVSMLIKFVSLCPNPLRMSCTYRNCMMVLHSRRAPLVQNQALSWSQTGMAFPDGIHDTSTHPM